MNKDGFSHWRHFLKFVILKTEERNEFRKFGLSVVGGGRSGLLGGPKRPLGGPKRPWRRVLVGCGIDRPHPFPFPLPHPLSHFPSETTNRIFLLDNLSLLNERESGWAASFTESRQFRVAPCGSDVADGRCARTFASIDELKPPKRHCSLFVKVSEDCHMRFMGRTHWKDIWEGLALSPLKRDTVLSFLDRIRHSTVKGRLILSFFSGSFFFLCVEKR